MNRLSEWERGNAVLVPCDELKKMQDKLKEAVAVIEWYGDKENWDDDFTPTIWDDGNVDLGNRAREFLEKYK